MSSSTHPDGQDAAWVSAYIDQVGATIRENGWAIQGIFATENSDIEYDFAYTIGLLERGCTAELMVAGLPLQVEAEILNEIASEMLNNQQMLPPATWPLVGGYELKVRLFIPRADSELSPGTARLYYNRMDVPIAQYVWPDQDHRYPWDEGWDPGVLQPVGNG